MDGAVLQHSILSAGPRQIRFMTAGSVDDGKSTLIGRLLLDSGALMRDQAATIADNPEGLAELTDGLEAERAQGITIDVAYRYFETPEASFLIADAPGHEQYTRNMVTAASNSDVAVIVIDATGVRGGVLKPQTRRHAAIAALMGLDLIVAVNKMDLLDWSEERFQEVETAFRDLAASLKIGAVTCVPISARSGANVVRAGGAPWWRGPTLTDVINQSRVPRAQTGGALRIPVQAVLRDVQTRYYAGRVEQGVVRPGDNVFIGPRRQAATVSKVRVGGTSVPSAEAGAAVTIEFTGEHDVTRGDVIAGGDVGYVRTFAADLCWLDEAPLAKGRRYVLRQGTLETQALIEEISFVHNVADFSRSAVATPSLALNDIARVRIATRDPVLADLYADSAGTGAFALFNPQSNQTCGAGMIREVFS
jgi:sulfate adenylyltransferase subunit 1